MPAPVTTAGGPPRLLVVVAHPDDETFGCGSLLLHAAQRRAETYVVCATRGEAGQSAGGGPVHDLGAVREAELHEAARLLGVARVELLNYVDSGMDGPAGHGTLAATPLDQVSGHLRGLVEELRPDVVVTLDASDGHRDHAKIRDATLAAVETASWRPDRVYLQCLAQSLMRTWLEHVRAEHPDSGHLLVDVPGTPDDQITTLVDTREHLAARERAMLAHASQASPYDGLPAGLREQFLTVDRLRRVVPPWPGGPVETDIFRLAHADR